MIRYEIAYEIQGGNRRKQMSKNMVQIALLSNIGSDLYGVATQDGKRKPVVVSLNISEVDPLVQGLLRDILRLQKEGISVEIAEEE
jgi:hypothetical protein